MFCDKTGTLTKNVLSFKSLSIPGTTTWNDGLEGIKESPMYKECMKTPEKEAMLGEFWRCATLCHDIIIFKYNDKDHFSGSSQDEVVLIEAAKETGFSTLIARDMDSMTIQLSHG